MAGPPHLQWGGGLTGQEGAGQTCSGGGGGSYLAVRMPSEGLSSGEGPSRGPPYRPVSGPCGGILGSFSVGHPEPARGPCHLLPSMTVRLSPMHPCTHASTHHLPVLAFSLPLTPSIHPSTSHTTHYWGPALGRALRGAPRPHGEALTSRSTGDIG